MLSRNKKLALSVAAMAAAFGAMTGTASADSLEVHYGLNGGGSYVVLASNWSNLTTLKFSHAGAGQGTSVTSNAASAYEITTTDGIISFHLATGTNYSGSCDWLTAGVTNRLHYTYHNARSAWTSGNPEGCYVF